METMSKKHDVPINHLDYSFISECQDAKQVERIVRVLRSGEEGKYPDLEAHAETRLEELNPKSRMLIKDQPIRDVRGLPIDDQKNIFRDLDSWSSEIKSQESGLQLSNGEMTHDERLPPVRGATSIPLSQNCGETNKSASTKNNQRRNWSDWDKVDIEAELEKVDTDKPKTQSASKNILRSNPSIPDTVPSAGMTDDEKRIKADREKEKGNEAFRSGDYTEAVLYYTRSLSLNMNVAARNNRAQAYLKLERWDSAITDVEAVLSTEPNNVKAYLRRGVALQGKRKFIEARNDLQKVMDMEPNNKRAKGVLEEVERALAEQKTTGRRMVITETDSEEEEDASAEEERTEPVAPESSQTQQENNHTQPKNNQTQPKTSPKIEDISENCDTEKQTPVKDNTVICDSETVTSEAKIEEITVDVSDNRVKEEVGASDNERKQENCGKPEQEERCSDAIQGEETKNECTDSVSEPVVEPVLEPPPPLPQSVVRCKDRGNELFRAGRYPDAMDVYTDAISQLQSDPRHAASLSVLYSNRAACKHKTGDCRGSVEDCNEALTLQPGTTKVLLRRATAYEALEKYRQAYVDYQQIVLTEHNADVAQHGATRCQKHLQENDGPRWRDKLPAMSPMATNDRPLPTLTAQTGESDRSEELKALREETRVSLQYDGEKEKGNDAVKKGSFSEAITCYSRCVELCPGRAVAYTNRALCYLRMNQAEHALVDCDKALHIEPQNVKATFRKAQALKMLAKYSDSVQCLEQVLTLDKNNTAARRELHVVKTYISENAASHTTGSKSAQTGSKPATTGRKKIQIQEVSSDSEDDQQQLAKTSDETNKIQPTDSQKKEQTSGSTVISEAQNPVKTDTRDTRPNRSKSSRKRANKKGKKQQQSEHPQIPVSTPQTGSSGSEAASSSPEVVQATESRTHAVQNSSEKDVRSANSTGDKAAIYDLKAPKSTNQIKPTAGLMGNSSKVGASPRLDRASAFEFVAAWTALKNTTDTEQYLALLTQVQPENLPTVISNKLEGDMLNMIVKCAGNLADTGKPAEAFSYLQYLTQVPRFEMNTMFMSSAEKQDLKNVLNKFKKCTTECNYSSEDVDNLGKKYGL